MTDQAFLRDPIYQLNLVLWLLEDVPSGVYVRPVLKELGYEIFGIGRQLVLPPAVRELAASRGIVVKAAPRPDVIARKVGLHEFLSIECKGSSFGPDSSDAAQALALIAASGDVRGPFGLPLANGRPIPGFVIYVIPEGDAPLMAATLGDLQHKAEIAGLPDGMAGCLGLDTREDGVYIVDRYRPGRLPEEIESYIGGGLRVHQSLGGEATRALYFIPWDPSVNQGAKEQELCRRILLARVQAEVLAQVGPIVPPAEIRFQIEDLLDRATFGMARRWLASGDVRHVRRAIRGFVEARLRKAGLAPNWIAAERTVSFRIETDDSHDRAVRVLEAGESVEEAMVPEETEQVDLFESND